MEVKKEQLSQILYGHAHQAENVLSSLGRYICFISDLVCRAGGFVPPLQSECISLRTGDVVLSAM